jgi:hypothetical protein
MNRLPRWMWQLASPFGCGWNWTMRRARWTFPPKSQRRSGAPEAATAFEKLAFTHRKEYACCAANLISRNRDNLATRRQRDPAMPESHQPQNFTTHTKRPPQLLYPARKGAVSCAK